MGNQVSHLFDLHAVLIGNGLQLSIDLLIADLELLCLSDCLQDKANPYLLLRILTDLSADLLLILSGYLGKLLQREALCAQTISSVSRSIIASGISTSALATTFSSSSLVKFSSFSRSLRSLRFFFTYAR